jgi:hypothetical protein
MNVLYWKKVVENSQEGMMSAKAFFDIITE